MTLDSSVLTITSGVPSVTGTEDPGFANNQDFSQIHIHQTGPLACLSINRCDQIDKRAKQNRQSNLTFNFDIQNYSK